MVKKTNTEREFKKWKRRNGYKSKINEGFLDDDKPATETPDALDVANDEKEVDTDMDVEDLLGDKEEEKETEKGDVEDSGTSVSSDAVGELKDIISNLNTTVQTLADTISKQAEKEEQPEEPAAEDEFSDLDFGGEEEGSEEEPSEDAEGGEEESSGDEGESAEGSESKEAPSEEGKSEGENAEKSEGGEEKAEEESEEEYAGDDEENKEKSEAYNRNMKHGKLLNSNSGSLIGPLETGKTWKLDESILTLVKMKLRQRIEEAKRELRAKILKDSEGEL